MENGSSVASILASSGPGPVLALFWLWSRDFFRFSRLYPAGPPAPRAEVFPRCAGRQRAIEEMVPNERKQGAEAPGSRPVKELPSVRTAEGSSPRWPAQSGCYTRRPLAVKFNRQVQLNPGRLWEPATEGMPCMGRGVPSRDLVQRLGVMGGRYRASGLTPDATGGHSRLTNPIFAAALQNV